MGVADVPVSANRSVDSGPGARRADQVENRRHTAGMQLRRVAPWRATASQISSAAAVPTSTTASRACHCWRAMVHAPMWNSG